METGGNVKSYFERRKRLRKNVGLNELYFGFLNALL